MNRDLSVVAVNSEKEIFRRRSEMLRLRMAILEVSIKLGSPILLRHEAIDDSDHEGEVETITDFHLADW